MPFFIRHLSKDTVELLPYQGESLNGNRLQKYIEDISVGSQTLSLQKMPANFSYIQGHLTVIGGVPDWIQRSEYLKCPDCQKTMHHIAEIPLDHIWKDRSGKIYCQGCPDCRMVGLFHQRR